MEYNKSNISITSMFVFNNNPISKYFQSLTYNKYLVTEIMGGSMKVSSTHYDINHPQNESP